MAQQCDYDGGVAYRVHGRPPNLESDETGSMFCASGKVHARKVSTALFTQICAYTGRTGKQYHSMQDITHILPNELVDMHAVLPVDVEPDDAEICPWKVMWPYVISQWDYYSIRVDHDTEESFWCTILRQHLPEIRLAANLAFAMGTHSRLGEQCVYVLLPPENTQQIIVCTR